MADECKARKERRNRRTRRSSITKCWSYGSTVNDKIRLFNMQSQDISPDKSKTGVREKQEHAKNVRGRVKDMVSLFEASASASAPVSTADSASALPSASAPASALTSDSESALTSDSASGSVPASALTSDSMSASALTSDSASNVQRRSVLPITTPRRPSSENSDKLEPSLGQLIVNDTGPDAVVLSEPAVNSTSVTDSSNIKNDEDGSQEMLSFEKSGLSDLTGTDMPSEIVVQQLCESSAESESDSLFFAQNSEETVCTNDIVLSASLTEVDRCSYNASCSAQMDPAVQNEGYGETKTGTNQEETETEKNPTAIHRRRNLVRSDAFDKYFETEKSRKNSDVADRMYHLPWSWKRQHYQNYSRKSDETLSQQIDTLYNSTTCLDLASYLLIRNGRRTIFTQMARTLSTSPVALEIITGPRKILWQNVPEVLSSGCLLYMSKKQINLQEALFEIITSEASYVYSLSILEDHYMKHIKKAIPFALTEKTFNALFSTLEPIIKSAHIFLGDLLHLWHQDLMLNGMCQIIEKHYESFAKLYLKYARNSQYILETYHQEVADNEVFRTLALGLAETPQAEKLPLDSFLTLPLQRITRMPLLLKSAIAQSDPGSSPQYINTLFTVESLVSECNEEVGRMRQYEEMLRIAHHLTFPPKVINFPLVKEARFLQLRSPARRVKNSNRPSKRERLELFLFNDLFLYAKYSNEKPSERLFVCDYCPRSALTLRQQQNKTFPQSLLFQLLSNSVGRKETLEVLFELESDRQRWLTVFHPKANVAAVNGTKQQMIALHRNVPQLPDELALEIGDVVVVLDQQDGLVHGARLADGVVGWFSASCCKPITSPIVHSYNERATLQYKQAFTVTLDESVIEQESTA